MFIPNKIRTQVVAWYVKILDDLFPR